MRKKIKKRFFILGYFALFTLIAIGTSVIFSSVKKPESLYPGLRYLSEDENVQSYIDEQSAVCGKLQKKDPNRYPCLKSLGKLLVNQIEFKKIVIALNASSRDCHDEMHYIVNEEYRNGLGILDIWKDCSTACFGACYHGGLEGLLAQKNLAGESDEVVQTTLLDVCDSIKDKFSTLYYQCFHGLGHAFMLVSEGDLPKSLRQCDSLDGEWQGQCYGGVFMENLPNSTTFTHVPRFIKKDDPLYPCNAIDKKYQAACYGFQTSYFSYLAGQNVQKLIKLCNQVPREYRNDCFRQIGLINIDVLADKQTKAQLACNMIPIGIERQSCIEGLIVGFSDRFPGNITQMKRHGIFEFCLSVEDVYKEACFTQIGRTFRQFVKSPSELEKECGGIKELSYRKLCQN